MQAVLEKLNYRELSDQLRGQVTRLSAPVALKRLQWGLLACLLVWIAVSIASLIWSLWSGPSLPVVTTPIVNPPSQTSQREEVITIDVESMLGLGLFGNPVNTTEQAQVAVQVPSERDGIEAGAKETRLDLTLVGTLVTSTDGLGTAVIEARKTQSTYAVGDSLPVSGDVTLAKVLTKQVVLNNGGRYELLTLFEDNPLAKAVRVSTGQSEPLNTPTKIPDSPNIASGVVIDSPEATAIAARYRDRLYNEPESLARTLKVSAVNDENGIYGYRVAPGSDATAFKALGFESGDIVTAVNGLDLSDPANTVSLYQSMRDATEATFELKRGDTMLTLSVSLGQLR
ncbi:MAG: type II secretion system protein GspC [Proteobacteria bacterium]|nr:type II secretion system protein GspC [Pseudomonadota bacterium]